jgi:tetratricopeptide (TPR) repeat protein
MKRYALAVKDFDKAIELDSRAVDAYCNRGSANYQLGKSDLAIKDYNEGLKIDPDDADLYYNRGIVNLSKGLKRKAKADFKKAARLGHRLASEMISRQE